MSEPSIKDSISRTIQPIVRTIRNRAGGERAEPFAIGPDLFQAIIDRPEGLLAGKSDPKKNIEVLVIPKGRIKLTMKDFEDWIGNQSG